MSVVSTNPATNGVKPSLFTRFMTLLADFGNQGAVAGPINGHNNSVAVTGGPQPTEPSPQVDAVAENYYAYLPLFVP